MNTYTGRLISIVLATSIGFQSAVAPAARAGSPAPSTTPSTPSLSAETLSRADYEACQARDDDQLRRIITSLSTDGLQKAVRQVDYHAVVAREWRRLGLDTLIEKRVDLAILDVRSETGWGDLLQSLANTEKAQKLATEVAERVYQSEPVVKAIEELARAVARDVGKSMELAGASRETALLDCLKAFIGPRYGDSVARAAAGEAGASLSVDASRGIGEVSSGAVLKEAGGGLAGATILIVRRQLANIAARVGQRIAGSVLSRLVSVVAGGIGLVLIAKDVWELRYGVLPIIATEMKAPATMAKVQDEIATTIAAQIESHVPDIARETAVLVLDVWNTFKRAHAEVLRLADKSGDFRHFLDSVAADRLPRLDEVVGLLIPREGDDGVLARLADGSLNTAVHIMPEPAMQIARDTGSVKDALAWHRLAGDRIASVIAYDMHKRTSPDGFSRDSLLKVFAVDDRAAVARLAALSPAKRDTLLSLPVSDLTALSRSLAEAELSALGDYLIGLREDARTRVLTTIAREPVKMQALASASVRDGILASRDQVAAIDMMLRDKRGFQPQLILADTQAVWEGQVDPRLLWHRHPAALVTAALLALILLVWVLRLFRPRGRSGAPPDDASNDGAGGSGAITGTGPTPIAGKIATTADDGEPGKPV